MLVILCRSAHAHALSPHPPIPRIFDIRLPTLPTLARTAHTAGTAHTHIVRPDADKPPEAGEQVDADCAGNGAVQRYKGQAAAATAHSPRERGLGCRVQCRPRPPGARMWCSSAPGKSIRQHNILTRAEFALRQETPRLWAAWASLQIYHIFA
eukprot:366333-Chlamydomonas_euryale.AAC.2